MSKLKNPGIELFHAEDRTHGLTDMTKIIDAFRSFANVPKEFLRMHLKSWRIAAKY